ncbi:putative NAD dependent epimerase/dehydratase [Xylariaceae sp. FL0016]|nr:putative NAD dependent epimerase/dehydratase [Xylariaceae sp. FL0016]
MAGRIFITGATGSVGNALAHDLLTINWTVNATIRDPNAPKAKALAAAGANLFPGNWDDQASLEKAMAGCTGLFMNLMPSFTDFTSDRKQAKVILAAAKAAGIKHVIYSSGAAMNAPERLQYYRPGTLLATFAESKRIIEEEVRTGRFESWTILRPAGFMCNWLAPKVHAWSHGFLETGVYRTAVKPDTLVASIDEQDLGGFATAAFKDPGRFHGQEIEIAAEIHTTAEIMERLSRASGRQLVVEYMSEEEIREKRDQDPFVDGQLVSRDMIQFIDLDEVRKWGVSMKTFEEYLERERDVVAETYGKQ